MRLAIRFLGLSLLDVLLETDDVCEVIEASDEPGDCTSYPVGFVSHHDEPDPCSMPVRPGWDE